LLNTADEEPMPKRTDTADSAARRRDSHNLSAATASPEEELSAYELLERRSLELQEERAHGGFGTSQAPNAAVPLLYPKPGTGRGPDESPAERSAKTKKRSRQAKKR